MQRSAPRTTWDMMTGGAISKPAIITGPSIWGAGPEADVCHWRMRPRGEGQPERLSPLQDAQQSWEGGAQTRRPTSRREACGRSNGVALAAASKATSEEGEAQTEVAGARRRGTFRATPGLRQAQLLTPQIPPKPRCLVSSCDDSCKGMTVEASLEGGFRLLRFSPRAAATGAAKVALTHLKPLWRSPHPE